MNNFDDAISSAIKIAEAAYKRDDSLAGTTTGLLDLDSKLGELQGKLKKQKGSDKDNTYKQIKAIKALKKHGLRAGEAYTMKAFPVLPPKLRPVVPGAKGDLLISDLSLIHI